LPGLIAMLPVRNEADRFLPQVLSQLEQLCDGVVVYDDASTDGTADLCRRHAKVELHQGKEPLLGVNEAALRRRLWHLVAARRPDWVLALDGDELFEERAEDELRQLTQQADYDAVAFRIFDFWKSETHVRVDGAWNPWERFSPLLVRYLPELGDAWYDQPIHCGRFPLAYRDRSTYYSHLRVRHYGWSRGEDHLRKYLFYRKRDLAVHKKVSAHTESVLSQEIHLEPWIEQTSAPWLRRCEEE
jgi:glycosyltransferase involved in cell wall biosynthesis